MKGHIKNKQYAEIVQENGEEKVLLVRGILSAHTLSLGEAYVRLERLLMERGSFGFCAVARTELEER